MRICDPDDPRVAPFLDIRERDLTGRQSSFVVEGTVVLRVLAQVQGRADAARAQAVLVLENRLCGVADILALLPPEVPVMVAARSVMDRVAGFPIHRGVLAIASKPPARDLGSLIATLPPRPLVLVASAISNHDNAGALFRNAAAFGADAVILDRHCCDPFYRKAVRVSVGAVLRVPFLHGEDTETIVAALDGRGIRTLALSPRGESEIGGTAAQGGTALLVGAEGEGLPPAILARLASVRIPQAPGLDSLNVATAAGIALYETARRMGRI